MTILNATNLGHSFGAQDLFSGISVTLDRRDRIGLVGPNGVGKTTLLQILAGLLEPRQGEVRLIQELEIGYLRQEAVLTFRGQSNSVFEEMLTVFDDLRQQEARLRELEQRMAGGETDPDIFSEYGELQQLYEHGGGYAYQHEIKRVLTGLGFTEESWQTPLTHLSGGQKTRVLLGRMLLEEPELLILDEPTNHLDMAAVEWLEQTLSRWSGALIIVSHDRYFLDRVVNGIWSMEPGRVRTYKGNYSSYVTQRQQQWEREKALFEREKARLEEEVDFIKRNIAGGNSDMARGRLRQLTRDVVLLEEHGVMAIQGKQWMEIGERVRPFSPNEAVKRVKGLQGPGHRPVQLNIRLQPEERSARTVLRTRDLRVGYDETIFTSDDIKLERYDCVALIGPNGSGKSTMLRTLLGEVEPMGGGYFLGDNLRPGYFAQAHEQLTPERSVLDELLEAVPMSHQDARGHLAHYLFRGDDVFKKVRDLSGGERGRLALAILALSGANFLLLDEPTNHLDIPAQEILQEVLEHFEGTIILVTHDRYLVDRLATQIWHLEEGHLHVFQGTYQEYLEARARAEEEAKKAAAAAASEATIEPEEPQPVKVPEEGVIPEWVTDLAPPPKLNRKGRRQRESRMSEVQLQMEDLEVVLDQLRDELTVARATGQQDLVPQLEEELAAAEREMLELEEEWNALEGGWVS